MSLKTISTNLKEQQGFTIVELLIVIVVIAILAAITIVSYNGITARANTSSAQANASTVAKKAEAFAADGSTSGYPTAFAQLTATTTAPYSVTGISATLTAPTSSNGKTTVQFLPCGHSGTTTAPNRQSSTGTGLTRISTFTGIQINYYDFANNRATTTATNPAGFTVGTVSGTVGTFPIACPTTQ